MENKPKVIRKNDNRTIHIDKKRLQEYTELYKRFSMTQIIKKKFKCE